MSAKGFASVGASGMGVSLLALASHVPARLDALLIADRIGQTSAAVRRVRASYFGLSR